VCSRTPRARASDAVSGRRQRDPDARARRRVVVAVDRLGAGGEDRVAVFDDVVGRQAAGALAEVHRAAARVEADADRARGVDLDAQQVARVAGEDVVVVGRRRAPRPRELGEPGARRGGDGRVVDVLPDRVERDEPLEQRRLLRVAARGVLVEVVVAVDEAGRGQASGGVDAARGALAVGQRRGARADGDDAVVLDDEVAVGDLAARGVDGRDRAALDDDDGHARSRPAAAASRTASMIFA
jgi:hypothetical protein